MKITIELECTADGDAPESEVIEVLSRSLPGVLMSEPLGHDRWAVIINSANVEVSP